MKLLTHILTILAFFSPSLHCQSTCNFEWVCMPPTPPPSQICESEISFTTLYRIYRSSTGNHAIISSYAEAQNTVNNGGYIYLNSPGVVVLNATDCFCGESLIPIRRLYRSDTDANVFTASRIEANSFIAKGYRDEGIQFYCVSSTFGESGCGASVPLYRYMRKTSKGDKYINTASENEASTYGGNFGLYLCNIWDEKTSVPDQKPVGKCTVTLKILYRLYRSDIDNHALISSYTEAENIVKNGGYTYQKASGRVALNATDCVCEQNLIPIRRLYKPSPEDNVFTGSQTLANNFISVGYTDEGIRFYCSATRNRCGASVPLYIYVRITDIKVKHLYTADQNEGITFGGTSEGILCYIWPI